MARIVALNVLGRSTTFAFVAVIASLLMPATAQAYPQLHVTALSQRVDRATVAPGDVFHVTIHVTIAQQRDRIDELILGSFENCEIISNETVRTSTADSTDFVERLTVQALAPGEATVSPAYIDAVDPTLGKPMRFSSNAVRVRVTGTAPLTSGLHALADTARRLLLAAAIVAGFAAAVFVLGVMFVRRRRRPKSVVAAAPLTATPVIVPSGAPDERLRLAAHAFATARSPMTLSELRAVVFELAGVGRGATLVDALAALGQRDTALRDALLAAERTTFGPERERAAAGDALLAAIAVYLERPTARGAWTA